MERTLITKLVEWKEKVNRKPLILKGVRQCGKTYLLKQFGKRYYELCAYFNFEENGMFFVSTSLNNEYANSVWEMVQTIDLITDIVEV